MYWVSADVDVVSVEAGELSGLAIGRASIIAEDRHNPLNKEKITV